MSGSMLITGVLEVLGSSRLALLALALLVSLLVFGCEVFGVVVD